MDKGEKSKYADRIRIDENNHMIDAREKVRIFLCTGHNVKIRKPLFPIPLAQKHEVKKIPKVYFI